jgi:ribosomal protein S18 acetylase RimI-like enzyme
MSRDWPEPVDEETVRRAWTAPGVDLEQDARVEDDAYLQVEGLDEGRVWIDVRGRPTAAALDWAEARALEKGTRVLTGAWTSNRGVLAELEQRGFRLVRHSHRMEIDLDAPIPEPVWPEGTEVRTFRSGDERIFYDLFSESFADTWEAVNEPYEEWAHWLLQPPAFVPDLWFLALANDQPGGFAVCHPRAGTPDLGWVRLLGVKCEQRRRGLGRALLLHAFRELRRKGFRRAGLGVDAESITGANVLYERAGMRISARFDILEKALS